MKDSIIPDLSTSLLTKQEILNKIKDILLNRPSTLEMLGTSWNGQWTTTMDNRPFLYLNDGKRFICFNTNFENKIYMEIREDCDTRASFNGFITNLDDFILIYKLVW